MVLIQINYHTNSIAEFSYILQFHELTNPDRYQNKIIAAAEATAIPQFEE
jgi:hypothetical protein